MSAILSRPTAAGHEAPPHAATPSAPGAATPGEEPGSEAQQLPTSILDGARGLLALYVMLGHARGFLLLGPADAAAIGTLSALEEGFVLAGGLTRFGQVAVLAFFVISGYAIHYRQAQRLARGERSAPGWLGFGLNRVRRIHPPLIAALLLTAALAALGQAVNAGFYSAEAGPRAQLVYLPTFSDLAGTLLMVNGFVTRSFAGNGPLWSLAYEAFFYLLYPAVFLLSRRWGPVPALAAITSVGMVAAGATMAGLDAGILELVAAWPIWVVGAFLAEARLGRVRLPARFWTVALIGGLLALAVLAVIDASVTAGAGTKPRGSLVLLLWGAALAGPTGWLVVRAHPPAIRATLERIGRRLDGLGVISYSLYVVHYPVLAFIAAVWLANHEAVPATPVLFAFGAALTIPIAIVVHRVAERPFQRRRVADVAEPPATVPAPPAAAPVSAELPAPGANRPAPAVAILDLPTEASVRR